MRFKEYDIVIEPSIIIFEHFEPSKIYSKTLNIKNVGSKSRRMELFRPSNKVFQLKYKNADLPVPPGMEIVAVIEFNTSQIQDYQDKIVISIDNKEIDVPIEAFPARPNLEVLNKVDFGLLSDNHKTVSKFLKIRNKGARDGQFSINYKGDLSITFVPSKEIIPAHSDFKVRVDFFTNRPVKLNQKIEIEFEGKEQPSEFELIGDIMKRELILLDTNSFQPINKLDFGSCYYGCNLLNVAILFNSSPEKVDYVILLEEKGLGVEIGAELSKSTNALKSKSNDYKDEDFSPVNKLVSAFPNNGTLEPFEKRPIFFRFSPQYQNPKTGFLTTLQSPPRRDYAVFLFFELLGNNKRTEIAITGTALPILLRIEPDEMDFGGCIIGQKKEIQAVICNDSDIKEIRFCFKKVANYTVSPACGRIPPMSCRNVLVSFIPHQMGTFNYKLNCQIIDKVADSKNPLHEYDKGIYDFPISLHGHALAITAQPNPKYCTGLNPILTNEVGLNVNTTVQSLKSFSPKITVQNAARESLHKISNSEKIVPGQESKYKIAFPNDRSKSIAPFNRYEKYKTLYTGADRYNYIDPDYAFTEEELIRIEKNKMIYRQYIDDLRFFREEKRRNKEFKDHKNSVDNNLIPACGLKPLELGITNLKKEATKFKNTFNVNPDWQLVSSGELANKAKQIKNALNSENSQILNKRDKEKVSVQLTPAQIYKIIVNPSVIDFGEVSVKSISIKNLEFFNTLDQPIYIELETDCAELGNTNPCGQVIAPNSKGIFPIIFESSTVQTFQRSISYRINFCYRHHVIILAEVKLPSLKLNTNYLVLTQLPGVQPDLCYRSNITIINPYNTNTEFTWIPIYGEQGTAFSIRPASGMIEPFKDLECEVVWHGSFLAPLKGTFSLQIRGGDSTTLNCEAKLGSTQLQFINKRSNYGKIPVNITTTKTFYLTNTGSHNAYFQVLDTKPIPGMSISPAYGLAPLNALTAIKCEMNPKEIIKFDAKILIQIRGGKQLELRLSGESEEPIIDIDMAKFEFGGIFSGAVSKMPFKIVNISKVKARVEINLKRYHDFSIKSQSKMIELTEKDRNYELFVNGDESVSLELVFAPTEVASYEFELPISVNRLIENLDEYVSTTPYTDDFTSAGGKTPITRKSSRFSLFNFIPKRKVIAIGLRPAIEISNPNISFKIPIAYFERLRDGGFFEAKGTQLINKSHKPVKWCIDLRKSNKVLEDGIFKLCDGSLVPFVGNDKKSFGPEGVLGPNETCDLNVLFSPNKPGIYNCKLPIVINDHFEQPFYHIYVVGELLEPVIKFEPEVLILRPVPLGVKLSDQFFIRPVGYEKKSNLKLEIQSAKAINGDLLDVLNAQFINESIIDPNDDVNLIEVSITFLSNQPISNSVKLKFTDDQNREFFYNVVVTSDNSLFTCYGFLADHNSDYQIVLETGQIMKGTRSQKQNSITSEMSGEPILRPCSNISRLTNNRSVSPTFDMNALNEDASPLKNQDDEIQAAFNDNTPSNFKCNSRLSTILTKAHEPIVFPSCEQNSGIYAFEVLKVLQRWFKVNGWPTSHNLVRIPESFRAGVSRKQLEDGNENIPQQDSIKRENKTIYEMIGFLCGRMLPAIPLGAPVPNDLTERATQFYWQHNVFLKFLETEGGCVAHVKPDHLLDIKEFEYWLEKLEIDRNLEEKTGFKDISVQNVDSPNISAQLFPFISKKAWLDCLLQLLKVCVLNRITPKAFKSSPVPYNEGITFPDIKSDPLTSNIYSIGERILLTWLNFCYANYKDVIWYEKEPGGEPPSRWIVNFDVDLTDSLAIGSVLGAYCPFLIETHLKRMYATADTAEKCFHNALILIECCRKIGLDYDINSLDITDPNSISLVLFCAFLFQKLPLYLPSCTIDFSSILHQVVTKEIKVANPSNKNIFYEAILIGPNKENFSLPKGIELSIGAKSSAYLNLEFNANNLKPGNAYLILVGKKRGTVPADTIVFYLKTCIDELTAKKIIKFQTPLYSPLDLSVEVENPYDQAGEFSVRILESDNVNGTIQNPFKTNSKNEEKFELPSIKPSLSHESELSKTSSQSSDEKLKLGTEKIKQKQVLSKDFPIFSAFYTKTQSIKLNANGKCSFEVNYLPLQMIKHSAIILFSNEKMGEFLYYLEGNASLPKPNRTLVDEKNLDASKVKYIKSNRPQNRTLTFKCVTGDKIKIVLLLPACNLERENAIIMATEMRMSDEELNRRKVHGFLSSKSLLQSLENLTLNKKIQSSAAKSDSKPHKTKHEEINYSISTNLNQYLNVQENLLIKSEDTSSDDNLIPLLIEFKSFVPGNMQTNLELKFLPNDVRIIPLEFKVTEGSFTESSAAFLKFNTNVFDSIRQPIPIKNNSEITCNYLTELTSIKGDKSVFKGISKFSVPPKDFYTYELKFIPSAEEKYEAELKFQNITEGTSIRYNLTGFGEKAPPLGEIKLETRVGQSTTHEILIPNKSNKKICYYVYSNTNFIKGPEKIMVLPSRKEPYIFEINPLQRGEFKGAITFKPGEWPIKDIDSDGDEIYSGDANENPQNFTLWYTFDIKVQAPPHQALVELETNAQETATLCIPLSNPVNKKMEFKVLKNGPFLEGEDSIEILPKQKYDYQLKFSPCQVGKFRGSLIFLNEETGEFWYDLKLVAIDPLPIAIEPVEAEVGRYNLITLKLKNPLNEKLNFRVLISNTHNFSLEKKHVDRVTVGALETLDVNVVFTPSTIGIGEHFGLIQFFHEKVGNLSYELRGIGLEPDTQDPINITSEICSSEMITINFRNSTDSAIYCDLILVDQEGKAIKLNDDEHSPFNILLNKFDNVHVAPRGILDIPIVFSPNELKSYNVYLIITARREGRMNWAEKNPDKKIEKLRWIYPIKAFSVINAFNKTSPFVVECKVRHRLEKTMEIVLANVTTYSSGLDRGSLRMRSMTPKKDSSKTTSSFSLSDEHQTKSESIGSFVMVGDTNKLANEFVYHLHFSGNLDQCELAQNSIAIKLVRVEREKGNGLVNLIFHIVFCPSKSFIVDADLQVETAMGGMWRYPLKLVSLEPPPDDTIIIEGKRLNKESVVGFRLSSKIDKALPFEAFFSPNGTDNVFSVSPEIGELLPDDEDGTLIKIHFIPPAYGKVYQKELIISTPLYKWKYLVKGVTPEYIVPRGQSAIPAANSRLKKNERKRNFIIENTYIIHTAVSSPIKGASLLPIRLSNMP